MKVNPSFEEEIVLLFYTLFLILVSTSVHADLQVRKQPRSQRLSSAHPKGSERRKTLVQAGQVS